MSVMSVVGDLDSPCTPSRGPTWTEFVEYKKRARNGDGESLTSLTSLITADEMSGRGKAVSQ